VTASGATPAAAAVLPPATTIGAVHLTVQGLDRMVDFYRERIGLEELSRDGAQVRLGAGGRDLVTLVGDPRARRPGAATGLYHLAVLVPSRAALAGALRHLARTRTPLQGASDHLVSEALYLADPEGNGIEIYRDRPAAQWPRGPHGIAMATEQLDIDGLLAEAADAPEAWRAPAATRIGHVHLKVSDVAAAERFYVGVLGFELMARYGRAAGFVAAGGYHHHIGFNAWESAGAPMPPEGSAGLREFEIRLPGADDLAAVRERLTRAGADPADHAGTLTVRDPSGNVLALRSGD